MALLPVRQAQLSNCCIERNVHQYIRAGFQRPSSVGEIIGTASSQNRDEYLRSVSVSKDSDAANGDCGGDLTVDIKTKKWREQEGACGTPED